MVVASGVVVCTTVVMTTSVVVGAAVLVGAMVVSRVVTTVLIASSKLRFEIETNKKFVSFYCTHISMHYVP